MRYIIIISLAFLLLWQPGVASAADPQVCTSFAERIDSDLDPNAAYKKGMMQEIYDFIEDVVGPTTQNLFEAFTSSPTYKSAVGGAITLMIVFYGVGFTIGAVQASFGQVLVRLIKIGIIVALIGDTGWAFFSDYVVKFFSEGTDDLITGVMEIGTGLATPAGAGPFYQLDKLAGFLLQPDTVVALLGAIGKGGPYGAMMGGLMGIAVLGFVKLLLHALQKYAICYVARALVLGVAPVFFVFLLFDRTRNLFMSWVNVLINLSLQPLLLFTFLSFFIVLIQTSATDMFSGTKLCWSEVKIANGSDRKVAFWAFMEPVLNADGTPQLDTNGRPLYQASSSEANWNGSVACLLGVNSDKCPAFPVNIMNVLSFLILVYIAQRFGAVVERICSELSNAMVSLDATGKLEQFMHAKTSTSKEPNAGGAPTRKG